MKLLKINLLPGPGLIIGFGLILADLVTAQTFTTLHSFTGSDGDGPQAGLILSGSTLYGAADSGGASYKGTVFKLNTDGTGFTTLHSFTALLNDTNSDGAYPDGTLAFAGNTLYGTAYNGGTSGNGTVFAVNTNGTGIATVHSFTATSGLNATNSDGANPEVGVIVAGSTLYGTTENGGTSGYDAVFKVNTNGTGFTTLHSFTSGSDGETPAGLLWSGTTLYGTTVSFNSGNGTVFKLNTNGTAYTILHPFMITNFTGFPNGGPTAAPDFTNSDGALPSSLTLAGNTLYGTTYYGGSSGNGTVFKLNPDGTGFTTLHSFAASSTNSEGVFTNGEGTHPIQFTGLILSGSTLYGAASYGGDSGNGTLFALNTNGTGFTLLHAFTETDPLDSSNSDGANPFAGLMLAGSTLYGTTKTGGTLGLGTLFSVALSPPRLTIIRSGTNVVLTWPAAGSGFTLQSTTNLVSPAVWATVTPAPVVVSGQNTVTNASSGPKQFYRLIQ